MFKFSALLALTLVAVAIASPLPRMYVDADNTSWHMGPHRSTPAVTPPAIDDNNSLWTIKIPRSVPTPDVAPIVDGDNTSWHIGERTAPTPTPALDSDNFFWTIVIPRSVPTPSPEVPTPAADADAAPDSANIFWTIIVDPRSAPTPGVAPIVDGDNTSWHIGARTIPTPPVDSSLSGRFLGAPNEVKILRAGKWGGA
ncbi:hypothetical protein B0H13DRAFT_2268429 [Mycena leptocephala]|nr:hypothetical protein B0H13DRAFT_2268429 [Mycena leptocephala]